MDNLPDKPPPSENGTESLASVADLLRKESERLRLLAEELKRREAYLAEVEANYPHFRRFVYDKLREEFERTGTPLPEGKDLETIAQDEGGVPLEAFIDELSRKPDAP